MKGVHPVLSHSTLLVIGLVAMGMIVASLSSSFSSMEGNLVRAESEYMAESAKSKLLEIYSLANQSDYFSGTFQLNLPEKIGDKKYSLLLSQNMLTLRMPFKSDIIEINKTLSIDAELMGEGYMPVSVIVEKDGTMTMELV